MPYLNADDRTAAFMFGASTAGSLNFLITEICLEYLGKSPKNYQRLNDIIGALECAKLEFYRRACAPYEDIKIEENGDVYG